MSDQDIKAASLSFVQSLLNDHMLFPRDLSRFITETGDIFDPEYVRQEMENWYRTLGIEYILQRKFALATIPFTREELIEAHEQQEIVLCVPQHVTRAQLGQLFHLSSWALTDELIAGVTETEDFWFKTPKTSVPIHLNESSNAVKRAFDKQHLLGMSLNRYMVFAARMLYTTGQMPDQNYWVWLTRGRYDQKGILIAGFDNLQKFSVHAWLPHFQGPRCGARSVSHPDHL